MKTRNKNLCLNNNVVVSIIRDLDIQGLHPTEIIHSIHLLPYHLTKLVDNDVYNCVYTKGVQIIYTVQLHKRCGTLCVVSHFVHSQCYGKESDLDTL